MSKRLRKIVGIDGSSGITSSPTVLALGDDEVALVGYKVDGQTRSQMDFPDSEDVVRMPRSLYLEGARRLMEEQ